MPKRLPVRAPQNKGAKLPLLAPKLPESDKAGVFSQVPGQNNDWISRQPPTQPQQTLTGAQAAPCPPMPPLGLSLDHFPPSGLPQMSSRDVAPEANGNPSLSQGLLFNQGQGFDWRVAYNQACPQAYLYFQGTQQGCTMPLPIAPVAGPSYSNTEVQLPVRLLGQVIDLTADNGDDTLAAPVPMRPSMLHRTIDQSFPSGVSEPPSSLAEARAGKRRCDTAEEAYGVIGEGPSYQVKRRCVARRAQGTAEDAHATAERAALATTAELERQSREQAYKASPAESKRVEGEPEAEVQGGDKVDEEHDLKHSQGEQSSGRRKDSGYHEQDSNGERDGEKKAEPERTGQGDQESLHGNEVTPEDDFFDLLNLDMWE